MATKNEKWFWCLIIIKITILLLMKPAELINNSWVGGVDKESVNIKYGGSPRTKLKFCGLPVKILCYTSYKLEPL